MNVAYGKEDPAADTSVVTRPPLHSTPHPHRASGLAAAAGTPGTQHVHRMHAAPWRASARKKM